MFKIQTKDTSIRFHSQKKARLKFETCSRTSWWFSRSSDAFRPIRQKSEFRRRLSGTSGPSEETVYPDCRGCESFGDLSTKIYLFYKDSHGLRHAFAVSLIFGKEWAKTQAETKSHILDITLMLDWASQFFDYARFRDVRYKSAK